MENDEMHELAHHDSAVVRSRFDDGARCSQK